MRIGRSRRRLANRKQIEHNARGIRRTPTSMEAINSRSRCVNQGEKPALKGDESVELRCNSRHGELNYSVTSRQALSVSVIRATSPLLIDGRVRVHHAVMGDESRFHDFNKSYVMFRVVLLDNLD